MKVHVIGAGPAGSIAALSAIRNNHSVVMSEDHPVSGIPENCSGLFSMDGLESLKKFVDYRKVILNPINGADVYLGDAKLRIRKNNPIAYVCSRSGLDQELAANAENEGAKINYSERINRVEDFRANSIIGADGPFSFVAKHFGFPKITKYASTIQAHVKYTSEDLHAVEVFLSNEKFPGFFAWVIPHDEYLAEFGVGMELNNQNKAIDAWNNLLKLKGIEYSGPVKGSTIPIKVRRKTAMRKGAYSVNLVGDAAGQVKSTTGGGVIFGGNCAALAGKFINKSLRYELEWRARFGVDLAFHDSVHSYIAKLNDHQLSALGARLKKLNADEFLSEQGHMDKPTKMIGAPALMHMVKNIAGLV